jgi:hypothetical protein
LCYKNIDEIKTNSSLIIKEGQKAFHFLPITNVIDIRIASFLQRYMATANVICDVFSTNAADNLRRLAGLYGLKEASLHVMKAKCYSDYVNSQATVNMTT